MIKAFCDNCKIEVKDFRNTTYHALGELLVVTEVVKRRPGPPHRYSTEAHICGECLKAIVGTGRLLSENERAQVEIRRVHEDD